MPQIRLATNLRTDAGEIPAGEMAEVSAELLAQYPELDADHEKNKMAAAEDTKRQAAIDKANAQAKAGAEKATARGRQPKATASGGDGE